MELNALQTYSNVKCGTLNFTTEQYIYLVVAYFAHKDRGKCRCWNAKKKRKKEKKKLMDHHNKAQIYLLLLCWDRTFVFCVTDSSVLVCSKAASVPKQIT